MTQKVIDNIAVLTSPKLTMQAIDDNFDESDYLKSFGNLLSCMHNKVHVTLELGRSIAASCGKYYTHIVDIKKNRNHNYIIVDGGMHHIVYFGQQMAMKQPFTEVYPKKPKGVPETYTICGSLCSMNDILVKQAELLSPEIGDVICFENAGAYCMTEGMSLFLSRDIPAVYLIDENKVCHIARPHFETRILNKSDC